MSEAGNPLSSPSGKSSGWFIEEFEQLERSPDYIAESLALRLTEQAIAIMLQRGISQSELAGLMGVSRAYVSRVLNAPPNLTLRSIAQLAVALDARPEANLVAVPVASQEQEALNHASPPALSPITADEDVTDTASSLSNSAKSVGRLATADEVVIVPERRFQDRRQRQEPEAAVRATPLLAAAV